MASLNALLNRLQTELEDAGFGVERTLHMPGGLPDGSFLLSISFPEPDGWRKAGVLVTDEVMTCSVKATLGDASMADFPKTWNGFEFVSLRKLPYEAMGVAVDAIAGPLKKERVRDREPAPKVEIDEGMAIRLSAMIVDAARALSGAAPSMEPDDVRLAAVEIRSLATIVHAYESTGSETGMSDHLHDALTSLDHTYDATPGAPTRPRP